LSYAASGKVEMTKKKRMKLFVAEVSYDDSIEEFDVVAESPIQARDLIITYLPPDRRWKSIRTRRCLQSSGA
jgi:hypothetical protein